jgi:hypothetical protein
MTKSGSEPIMRGQSNRLDKLEDHAVRTEDRLNNIEKTQEAHGGKLDSIGSSLHMLSTQLTRYDSRPVFNFHQWIVTIGVLVAIFGALGSLATWFVLTMNAAENRVIALRIQHVEERVAETRAGWNWIPEIVPRVTK